MAYINVAEWTPDQVTDWLKGLDDSMYNYIHSFTNNEVGGQQLLHIRPYELEQLGMYAIGHQEIVLEAVEHLRNFHYNLDKENLQFLALHVATAARNLFKQLVHYCDSSKIETQILNDITRTIATIKPVISWLDRSPFHGHLQFIELRKNMLRLGLEMATSAQRDRFVEKPVEQIRMSAEKLAKLADYIIQDITDPMLLQPASLSLVTLKKRESELDFNIEPSYHGIHRISDIKYNSPAHNSGKIEDGDEIVQINYQTVVGWQYKTVFLQLRESSPDVLLTLKKRPKHTKIYGQIYMQPYRLPSKKRAPPGRWGENLPSPRAEFLPVQEFTLPLKINEKNNATSDTDSSCSDILTPTDSKSVDKELRLYMRKPRAVLQRRNTICGDELSFMKITGGTTPVWLDKIKAGRQNGDPSSPSLRDKSISFGFGLEIAPRPTTCLGIATNGKFNDVATALNNSLPEISGDKSNKKEDSNFKMDKNEEKSKPGVSKVVRFDANMKSEDYPIDNKYICNVENTILETFEPIPYVDEDISPPEEVKPHREELKERPHPPDVPPSSAPVQAVNPVITTRRGRLDKSHSTPAYDNSEDVPPAIEPRKEFLQNTPPAPPPRPRRQSEIQPPAVPPPPPKPSSLLQSTDKPNNSNQINRNTSNTPVVSPTRSQVPAAVHFLQGSPTTTTEEETELLTPPKTKSLTLKKKNSLLAKRRKVTLKMLGTGDIQGHLYRRTKDKRGITFWAKLYFILIESVLYGFRSKESQKANCMVLLPGFTVSLAKEVHSKSHAFKVYHPAKTLYFAAESIEALNQWMEFIRQATLMEKSANIDSSSENSKDFFSETDTSEDENDNRAFSIFYSSSTFNASTSTSNYNNNLKGNESPSRSSETSLNSKHEKYLGSLKKFTKTTLPFKSTEKKTSSDIPVPTAQFRSYRKVPGGCYGLQIGTNNLAYIESTQSPPSSHTIFDESCINTGSVGRKPSISSTFSTDSRTGTISSVTSTVEEEKQQLEQQHFHFQKQHRMKEYPTDMLTDKPKKIRKTSPYNYIHASNPNLVEFDFQTSKSLDFSLPKVNPSNSWDAHNNLQGFVTLKDLMLRKQEEEAKEMYNHRVLLGVEKRDERQSKCYFMRKANEDGNASTTMHNSSGGSDKLLKIQSRSLPKTPDYEMSFKPDDEDIKRTRTKEGLKLRDFGYEFIYGDDSSATGNQKNNSNNNGVDKNYQQQIFKKKNSLINTSNGNSDKSIRSGSFKKTKGKFEAFKTSSEKIFQFSKHSSSSSTMDQQNSTDSFAKSRGSSVSYSPLTLPLNRKSSQIYGIAGSGNNSGSNSPVTDSDNSIHPLTSGGIKKSHTYNSGLKDRNKDCNKHILIPRKNSAPMPILSKLSFTSTKSTKEKKLLGSPRLHRAIFGRTISSSSSTHSDFDHEIFLPITFPKASQNASSTDGNSIENNNHPLSGTNSPPLNTTNVSEATETITNKIPPITVTPEYPNMECPPVFEPETYSLSDPNASLTLLRRRNNVEDEN